MGGVALIARQLGYRVSGSDANVYPPMSTQLMEQGIELKEGYDPAHFDPQPDWVVIGNALSRGNPAVEYVLERNLPYISGPQFLADYVLRDRWVLAVAGTHGKTTTSSMAAWILEDAGLAPGFLIGGVPENFGLTARLGNDPFFVVEADEYDTAFFDKRSKFVHYRPRTLVINNLEFDHADIFPDLEAIKRQFHHLIRIVPGNGLIVLPGDDGNVISVLEQGSWTPCEYLNSAPHGVDDKFWQARLINEDGTCFDVYWQGECQGRVDWPLSGQHNVANGLAAIAATRHTGVIPSQAVDALNRFQGVKRRMELRGTVAGVMVYDDFAHHPTAIKLTLEGQRRRVGDSRIIAVLEARSNTMRMGINSADLGAALSAADQVVLYQAPELKWDLHTVTDTLGDKAQIYESVDAIIAALVESSRAGDHVLIMSNGAFGGIHQKLIDALHLK